MKAVFVFPGTFCPPTYGHVEIAKKASAICGEVLIVCSLNEDKEKIWFTQEECKEMWKTYGLCKDIKVKTFGELKGKEYAKKAPVVMIRGIRDEKDLDYEKKVLLMNHKNLGIKNFLFILSDENLRHISSTEVREFAQNLDFLKLASRVSPLVVTKLLEKALNIKNLFLVVGKPGSGKTTFLKMLAEKNSKNVVIETDLFNHQLRPLLEEKFGKDANLADVAIRRPDELKQVIGLPWLELLRKALRSVPAGSNIFLEIPYALQEDKLAFKYFGGKMIYIGCDGNQNILRVAGRGTPQSLEFIEKIPGKSETMEIARKHNLALVCIDSNGSLADLREEAIKFNEEVR